MYRLLLILVVALWSAAPAWAAEAGQVSVALRGDTPRGDEARADALRRGLETVIVRLTGRDQVADLPGVAEALDQPQRWLLRYGYEDGQPPRLRAVFDDRALTRYLADQGAPVWAGDRPPVLVWLVTEGTGRGDLVTAGDPLAQRLQDAAGRRGVSLVLPKWDQRDRDVVAVADVRGRFDGPVLQASRRYDTDWVATGVLYGGASTTLNWRLLDHGDQVAGRRAGAADTDAALDAFVSALADQIAERYSLGGDGGSGNAQGTDRDGATPPPVIAGQTPSGEVLIRDDRVITVRGVRTLKQWHDLYLALADLGPLRGVALRVASADRVQFELDFSGDRAQLERLMAGLPGLTGCTDASSPPLTYCLR
ncbi:DUF2066 domain-containing protein [Alloalcanivorax gelatiniphagus]|uniref:DUF2066 domain-containing protein n=2 Tax=Alloalcanivorax gelatiniphagus TaxID=1194167 RepID=A0ABY2XLI8_9GAMM|nr:DUF2066 domain-containing protein [Alloalcanivorax gelatiniphagus]TMW13054.1 DUF2066 domain-containing protein [Alloalcanivorax gelatiniphagus]